MRRVSEAQEAAPPPLAQAVDGNRQQLDIVPIFQFVRAPAQERSNTRDVFAKCPQTFLTDFFHASLLNYIRALPIVSTVQHHQDLPRAEAAQSLIRVTRLARTTNP